MKSTPFEEKAKQLHKLQERKAKLQKKYDKLIAKQAYCKTFSETLNLSSKRMALIRKLQSNHFDIAIALSTPLPKYPKGGVDMARPGNDAAAIITGGPLERDLKKVPPLRFSPDPFEVKRWLNRQPINEEGVARTSKETKQLIRIQTARFAPNCYQY